jgi:DNA replication protein DnaC
MPTLIGPVPSDKWEREVRRQLSKQLPANWFVICNVSWAIRNEIGYVRDGQADFVVLAPELGLAVVEVKGSFSVRVGDDGKWYRRVLSRSKGVSEALIKEPPPEQANRNMHTLVNILKNELFSIPHSQFPGLYAFLVAYPNGVVDGSSDMYDSSTIITKKNLHRLGGAIKKALKARGNESLGKKFTQEIAENAVKILTNQRFRVASVDTELIATEDEESIDELTRQQFAALRGAFELPRVAISGPAGSGKTLLAIWKLSALIEEGKRAIYVCFNKSLSKSLSTRYPELSSAIFSVDSLFWSLVDDHSERSNNEFYSDILPNRVMDARTKFTSENFYDAIIIDEGQDFGDNRVIALYQLLMNSADSQWLYFSDNNQDLYGHGSHEALGAEVIFRLYHNCRNTERINAATNKVCSSDVKPMPGLPSGEIPRINVCKGNLMAKEAWALINDISPNGGAVIISPYKYEKSCMNGFNQAHGLTLTEDINMLGEPDFVFYSTIKSFKGLEARHVVFVDADQPNLNPALTDESLYVAFTRATARLDILTTNPEAESWFSSRLSSLLE